MALESSTTGKAFAVLAGMLVLSFVEESSIFQPPVSECNSCSGSQSEKVAFSSISAGSDCSDRVLVSSKVAETVFCCAFVRSLALFLGKLLSVCVAGSKTDREGVEGTELSKSSGLGCCDLDDRLCCFVEKN